MLTSTLPVFFIQIVVYLLYYTLPFSLTVYIRESPVLEMENFSIFKAAYCSIIWMFPVDVQLSCCKSFVIIDNVGLKALHRCHFAHIIRVDSYK